MTQLVDGSVHARYRLIPRWRLILRRTVVGKCLTPCKKAPVDVEFGLHRSA